MKESLIRDSLDYEEIRVFLGLRSKNKMRYSNHIHPGLFYYGFKRHLINTVSVGLQLSWLCLRIRCHVLTGIHLLTNFLYNSKSKKTFFSPCISGFGMLSILRCFSAYCFAKSV